MALPPLQRGERHLRPGRDHRLDGRHSHHHGIADDVVHLVAFEDRLQQRHVDARLGRGRRLLATDRHQDFGFLGLLDNRLELAAAAVEHANRGARLQPEHTGQVLGLFLGEGDDLATALCLGRVEASIHLTIIKWRDPNRRQQLLEEEHTTDPDPTPIASSIGPRHGDPSLEGRRYRPRARRVIRRST